MANPDSNGHRSRKTAGSTGRKSFIRRLPGRVFKAILYGVLGGVVMLIGVVVWSLEQRPDLKVWHVADLDAEFTAASPVNSLDGYREQEDRLFDQLQDRVFARVTPEDRRSLNRFYRSSLADPSRWSPNWNRTFELPADRPRVGVLLLHGMSDSPYSLLRLGQSLSTAGAWVVGLRLPGHGTAPSGLLHLEWQDMAEAVRLAMAHLHDKVPDRPLVIVGYSNGGALAVHYALAGLEDAALPPVNRLVLISPALGVTRLAVLAVWQVRLSRLLGLNKLAWTDILPEYDPFKYNSFTVNAGDQVFRLTEKIKSRLKALGATGALARFPPVLAFLSVADATVSTDAVVDGLFNHLPAGGNELVLFDINRNAGIEHMLVKGMQTPVDAYFGDAALPFTVRLLTNADPSSQQLVVRAKAQGEAAFHTEPLDFTWPDLLVSLSHVALPFPKTDPLYGRTPDGTGPGIQLGNLALYGERGVLQVPLTALLRLRSNPFYTYVEQRVLGFLELDVPPGGDKP